MSVNSSLVEDIISLDEVKMDMTAVLSALKDDFTRNLSIRTSPGIQLFFLFLSCCLLTSLIVLFTPNTNVGPVAPRLRWMFGFSQQLPVPRNIKFVFLGC